MSKHPLDHDHQTDGDARSEVFTEIERRSGAEGDHPAAKALTKRPRAGKGARVAEYARIERGNQA